MPGVMLGFSTIFHDGFPEGLRTCYTANPLLAIPLLYKEHKEFLRTYFIETGSEECFDRILDMIHVATASRYSSLQLLLSFSRRLHRSRRLRLDSVAVFLLCIGHALLLPPDDESLPILIPLALSTHFREEQITFHTKDYPLERVLFRHAREISKTLMSIVASKVVFGRTNGRVLSCARASKQYMSAIGWLAPYTD